MVKLEVKCGGGGGGICWVFTLIWWYVLVSVCDNSERWLSRLPPLLPR